jgi:hypothetical protein
MLYSVEYFMLVWTCVRDCIKRDAGIWKLLTARQYFHNVIRKGRWWNKCGGCERRGWNAKFSILFVGPTATFPQLHDDLPE